MGGVGASVGVGWRRLRPGTGNHAAFSCAVNDPGEHSWWYLSCGWRGTHCTPRRPIKFLIQFFKFKYYFKKNIILNILI